MLRRNKVIQTLTYNWNVKLCAFILACLAFLFGSYYNQDIRTVTVPVSVTLPKSVEAASNIPTTVQVSIEGDGEVIYLIDPDSIKASVDFSFFEQEGIADTPIKISYDEKTFKKGGVTLEVQPYSFRVLFRTPGETEE